MKVYCKNCKRFEWCDGKISGFCSLIVNHLKYNESIGADILDHNEQIESSKHNKNNDCCWYQQKKRSFFKRASNE